MTCTSRKVLSEKIKVAEEMIVLGYTNEQINLKLKEQFGHGMGCSVISRTRKKVGVPRAAHARNIVAAQSNGNGEVKKGNGEAKKDDVLVMPQDYELPSFINNVLPHFVQVMAKNSISSFTVQSDGTFRYEKAIVVIDKL